MAQCWNCGREGAPEDFINEGGHRVSSSCEPCAEAHQEYVDEMEESYQQAREERLARQQAEYEEWRSRRFEERMAEQAEQDRRRWEYQDSLSQ